MAALRFAKLVVKEREKVFIIKQHQNILKGQGCSEDIQITFKR